MQFNNLSKLGLREMVFFLEPGKLRMRAAIDRTLGRSPINVDAGIADQTCGKATYQKKPEPLHGSTRHLVRIDRPHISRAPLGLYLSRSVAGFPIASAHAGKQEDSNVSSRKTTLDESGFDSRSDNLPKGNLNCGLASLNALPHAFLEPGWQLCIQLPGMEQLAQLYVFLEWFIVFHRRLGGEDRRRISI
jgi:hypothetical protein